MPTTEIAANPARSFQIEQELTLHAPRSVVFAALINDIGTWWGEHSYKPDRVKGIVVEPKVGGRFFEDWGNGEGWLFATVIGFDLDTGIDMVGPMGMDGPVVGTISYELADAPGGGTTLKLSHQAMGLFPEAMEGDYRAGWTDLLDTRLRAFVERGEKMGFHAKQK